MIETIKRVWAYLIRGSSLTWISDTIPLNNGYHTAADRSMSFQRNFPWAANSCDFQNHRYIFACNGTFDSSSTESSPFRRKGSKRSATCGSIFCCNRNTLEPRCYFGESSTVNLFTITDPDSKSHFPQRKNRKNKFESSHRVKKSRLNWKDSKLKFTIYKIDPRGCECLTMLRPLRSTYLKLPCNSIHLMAHIFEADPSLLFKTCLILMRRKFEERMHFLCESLNDVLKKMQSNAISELQLRCEIRSSHIGLKLFEKTGKKWKVCLLVGRVPICRGVRVRVTAPRDGRGTLTHRVVRNHEEEVELHGDRGIEPFHCTNLTVPSSMAEERSFYSPCSNSSLIFKQHVTLEDIVEDMNTGRNLSVMSLAASDELIKQGSKSKFSGKKYIDKDEINPEDLLTDYDSKKESNKQDLKPEFSGKKYIDDELNKNPEEILGDCDCEDHPTSDQGDTRFNPELLLNETKMKQYEFRNKEKVTNSRDLNSHWKPEELSSLDTPRLDAPSKTASIRIIQSGSNANFSLNKKCVCSEKINVKSDRVDNIDSGERHVNLVYVSAGLNNVSTNTSRSYRSFITPRRQRLDCECSTEFNKTGSARKPLVSISSTSLALSTVQDFHLKLNKVAKPRKSGASSGFFCHKFSRQSICRVKRLIRRKLRELTRLRKDKGTNTSKIFLTNRRYFVSVSKGKLDERRFTGELLPSYSCSTLFYRVRAKTCGQCGHSTRKEFRNLPDTTYHGNWKKEFNGAPVKNSRNAKFENWKIGERNFYNNNNNNNIYDNRIGRGNECKDSAWKNEMNNARENFNRHFDQDPRRYSKLISTTFHPEDRESFAHNSQWRSENFSPPFPEDNRYLRSQQDVNRYFDPSMDPDFHSKNPRNTYYTVNNRLESNEARCTKNLLNSNKKSESEYYSNVSSKKRSVDIPTLSECFLRISAEVGLTDICGKCFCALRSHARSKLFEYKTLCKSAKESLIKEFRIPNAVYHVDSCN